MKFEQVASSVKGIPFISTKNATFLYELICQEKISSILELGIAHGTATCFMAAAIDELGGGIIKAIDRECEFNPSPEEQLAKIGLANYVEIHRMKTGYNWFLHDEIVRNTKDGKCNPLYDLCIIDGPKNWIIDSSAFFLVDKLLKNKGWIIFDDYKWTYAKVSTKRDRTDGVVHSSLSEDEFSTPHIQEIFELLVKQHPNYTNFRIHNENWAIAQKIAG